jgi:hypothetical protein
VPLGSSRKAHQSLIPRPFTSVKSRKCWLEARAPGRWSWGSLWPRAGLVWRVGGLELWRDQTCVYSGAQPVTAQWGTLALYLLSFLSFSLIHTLFLLCLTHLLFQLSVIHIKMFHYLALLQWFSLPLFLYVRFIYPRSQTFLLWMVSRNGPWGPIKSQSSPTVQSHSCSHTGAHGIFCHSHSLSSPVTNFQASSPSPYLYIIY